VVGTSTDPTSPRSEAADPMLVGRESRPAVFEYGPRDVALYALSVGAGAHDTHLTWEGVPGGLRVLPSFCLVAMNAVGPQFTDLIHRYQKVEAGETIRVHRPLAPAGRLVVRGRIDDLQDKGRFALLVTRIDGADEQGRPVFEIECAAALLDAGGFGAAPSGGAPSGGAPSGGAPYGAAPSGGAPSGGAPSGGAPSGGAPSGGEPFGGAAPGDASAARRPTSTERSPDVEVTAVIPANQAALYQLNGVDDPLHVDAAFARSRGFEGPILHGPCTLGYATRVLVERVCGGDPSRLREIGVRFPAPVYPGDRLTIDVWIEGDGRATFQGSTQRGRVLTHGHAAFG
jgi:acyl dehydratase